MPLSFLLKKYKKINKSTYENNCENSVNIKKSQRVAFAFFGIARSLNYTIDSIKNNVFSVLKENSIDYDVYFHTYKLSNYENIRANEKNNNVDNDQYKLLNPDFIKIDNQDEIKRQLKLHLYRSHPDPWNTNYNSVDNFILAQYSKLQVTEMIENSNSNYDYIIFIRPDCYYIEKLNIQYLQYINNNTICTPNFHLFGKYKFNDRFAITNINTYKVYGNIFEDLLTISKNQPLHSETIIAEILLNHKINIKKIFFAFSRVRFNGIHADRLYLIKGIYYVIENPIPNNLTRQKKNLKLKF